MSPDGSSEPEASSVLNTEPAENCAETAPIRKLLHEDVTKSIIAAFFTVYNKLGYGFLENVYCGALALELRRRGHRVAREVAVPVYYDGEQVAKYRMDFIADDVIVLEVKSTAVLNPSDKRQLLNYLRATPLEVGLLLHFGPKPKFYRCVASQQSRRV
jgi:GxxExxY protein